MSIMSNLNGNAYPGRNASHRGSDRRFGYAGVRTPYATMSNRSVGDTYNNHWSQPRHQTMSRSRAQSSWNGWQCNENQPTVSQTGGSMNVPFPQANYSLSNPNWSVPGQNLMSFQQQMIVTPPPVQAQQYFQAAPSPQQQARQTNLVNKCMNVPYWTGETENRYTTGPQTSLQPADPNPFHQYFQQSPQVDPSKGVYVKIGAIEEQPVVYANGGFPENDGQGDVQSRAPLNSLNYS